MKRKKRVMKEEKRERERKEIEDELLNKLISRANRTADEFRMIDVKN